MKSVYSTGLVSAFVLLSSSACCSAATVTSASTTATATGRSKLDLEDQRAECFLNCYQDYGAFGNCEFGESKLLECWCSEPDWVEREEDCVWDVCGVDAYNEYASVYKRRCQTVQVPSGRPPTWTYSTELQSTSTAAPTTITSDQATAGTTQTSKETNTRDEISSISTTSSSSTSQETTIASDESNNSNKITWASGSIIGFIITLFII